MNFTKEEIEHICKRYNLQFIQTSSTEVQLYLHSDIFWTDAYSEFGGSLASVADFKLTDDVHAKYALYNTYNAFLLRDFNTIPPYFCLFRAITPAEKSHGDVRFLNTQFTYIPDAIQFMNYIHWILDTIPEAAKYLKEYKQNKLFEQIKQDF